MSKGGEPGGGDRSTWFIFGRVERGEWPLLLLSTLYFFLLLCGYSILRPLRDTAGIAGDTELRSNLFTATFLVMLLAVPLYGGIVARVRRSRFIGGSTLFFSLQLLAFAAAFSVLPESRERIGRVFFVWVSVFNLFVVSIFWSLMVDRWPAEAGGRIFGTIAAGGSLGAIVGSQLTAQLARSFEIEELLCLSAAILALTLVPLFGIERVARHRRTAGDRPVGGTILAGLVEIGRSPLLARTAALLVLLTICASLAYFARSEMVAAATAVESERTAKFAWTDTFTHALTFVLQLVGFPHLVRRAGIAPTLGLLPAVYALGFLILAAVPVWSVMVLFEMLRRGTAYGVGAPSRNLVFTVVGDEQKYKTKACIDTLVYRGGDVIGAKLYAFLATSVALPAISLIGVVLACAGGGVAFAVGRRVRDRLRARAVASAEGEGAEIVVR